MSVVLWPRQEVLQLVVPHLAFVGKELTPVTILELILFLKQINPASKSISFSLWKESSKEILKWNDKSSFLFWDLLITSCYFIQPQLIHNNQKKNEEIKIHLDFLIIFLCLHITDKNSSSYISSFSSSSGNSFDTTWPLVNESSNGVENGISSPIKEKKRENPLSPRSPRSSSSSSSSSILSPKRGGVPFLNTSSSSPTNSSSSTTTTNSSNNNTNNSFFPSNSSHTSGIPSLNRTIRSSTHYLHHIQKKLPLILLLLSLEIEYDNHHKSEGLRENDMKNSSTTSSSINFSNYSLYLIQQFKDYMLNFNQNNKENGDNFINLLHPLSNSSLQLNNIFHNLKILKNSLDSINLILCGGNSRDNINNSILFLFISSHQHEKESTGSSSPSTNSSSSQSYIDNEGYLALSPLLNWFNLHLSMNDVIYPGSICPPLNNTMKDDMDMTHPPSPSSSSGNNSSTVGTFLSPSSPSNSSSASPSSPSSAATSASSSSSSSSSSIDKNSASSPTKVVTPLSSLTRFSSTILNYFSSSTLLFITTNQPSRASSFKKISRSSSEIDLHNSSSSNFLMKNNYFSPSSNNSANSSHPSSSDDILIEDIEPFNENIDCPVSPCHSPPNNYSFPITPPPHSATSSFVQPATDFSSFFTSHSNSSLTLNRPEVSLPQLYINHSSNSTFYFLSPFYCVSLTGLKNCTVFIGSVFGTIILNGCENVRLSANCFKLIVINCMNCEISISSLSTSLFLGDNYQVKLLPINFTYRNLRQHIKVTELTSLFNSNSSTTLNNSSTSLTSNTIFNYWDQFIDVNDSLHSTSNSSISIINPDDFKVKTIPWKTEVLSMEFSCIPLPTAYTNSIKKKMKELDDLVSVIKEKLDEQKFELDKDNDSEEEDEAIAFEDFEDHMKIDKVKKNSNKKKQNIVLTKDNFSYEPTNLSPLISLASGNTSSNAPSSPTQASSNQNHNLYDTSVNLSDISLKLLASSTLSKRFSEWLVQTNNIQEVLDLIKIDTEKSSTHL